MESFDVIVLGAGPAGLASAIYCARYKLKTIVFGAIQGGMASWANMIHNYPGFDEGIPGFELMQKFLKQAGDAGVEFVPNDASGVEKIKNGFKTMVGKKNFSCKKIIIATGTDKIKLNAKNESKFLGRGVSYCSTCDGPLFKGKDVCVVGGGNSALSAAVMLSDFVSKVTIIYRGNNFSKADGFWLDAVKSKKNITSMLNEEVVEVFGDKNVEGVVLKDGRKLALQGVFIEIGSVPKSDLALKLGVKLDSKDYIDVDKNQNTNVKGVFAAGDVTNCPLRQVVTAVGSGAKAAFAAYSELLKEKVK